MAPDKSAHEEYIRGILDQEFNRELISLAPLNGGKNSTIYTISIGPSKTDEVTIQRQRPAVSPLPNGPAKLVMRLSNPDAMLNEAVRTQSEVATMALMRDALEPWGMPLVPTVYGWGPSGAGGEGGWVLMELMPGEPLADKFQSLGTDEKWDIVRQMAQVFKAIQSYELPATVRGFGGLNFDEDGNVVVGATPIHGGGPCETLQELYAEYFRTQLAFADKCDVVRGWRDTPLRDRLDKFAAEKLGELLETLPLEVKQTLVHADLDTHNLLVDPATNQLTAVVDYDFSHVASQGDEFFYSLAQAGHIVTTEAQGLDDPDSLVLRRCLLTTGFTPEATAGKPNSHVDWELAAMMDEALAEVGALRPRDIEGMEELSTLYWFFQDVSPPIFFLKGLRAKINTDKVRAQTQRHLDAYLSKWGY